MGDKVFVDTNILLRTLFAEMELHAESSELLKQVIQNGAELWISGQILREFMVQTTHPKTLKQPLQIAEVIQSINKIKLLFAVADDTLLVRDKLLELLQNYPTQGKQIHDANVVATMLAYGIETLLTLNIDDFKRFQDKIQLISLENLTP